MKKMFAVLAVLMVFGGNVRGQENANPVSDEKASKAFHMEFFMLPFLGDGNSEGASMFAVFIGPLLNRTLAEDSSELAMTIPILDVCFAFGDKIWEKRRYSPSVPCKSELVKTIDENGEETWTRKEQAVNWVFSGFGAGLVSGRGNGVLQLRLPIVGRRLAGNFWLTTGVGIMPFAKENHFGFTFGIQSVVLPY